MSIKWELWNFFKSLFFDWKPIIFIIVLFLIFLFRKLVRQLMVNSLVHSKKDMQSDNSPNFVINKNDVQKVEIVNHRRKINWGAVITAAGTILMAVFTLYLALATKDMTKATQGLIKADLEPHISLKDVMVIWVNEKDEAIRKFALSDPPYNKGWEGLTKEEKKSQIKIFLVIKLSNSGKLQGEVKVEGINNQPCLDNDGFLVPGMSDSPWIMPLEIPKEYKGKFYFDYILNISGNGETHQEKFSIKCDTNSVSCSLIPYEDHYKK